jgi:hypothetical protein
MSLLVGLAKSKGGLPCTGSSYEIVHLPYFVMLSTIPIFY